MACINSEIDEISIFNSNFIQVEYQWITGFASFGAYPFRILIIKFADNRKLKGGIIIIIITVQVTAIARRYS